MALMACVDFPLWGGRQAGDDPKRLPRFSTSSPLGAVITAFTPKLRSPLSKKTPLHAELDIADAITMSAASGCMDTDITVRQDKKSIEMVE